MSQPTLSLRRLIEILRVTDSSARTSPVEAGRLGVCLERGPGMPALQRLLEWPRGVPSLNECLQLTAFLETPENEALIRNHIYPDQQGQPLEEMLLPDIAECVNRLQGFHLF